MIVALWSEEIGGDKGESGTVERGVGAVDDRDVLNDAGINLTQQRVDVLNRPSLRHSVGAGVQFRGVIATDARIDVNSGKAAAADAGNLLEQIARARRLGKVGIFELSVSLGELMLLLEALPELSTRTSASLPMSFSAMFNRSSRFFPSTFAGLAADGPGSGAGSRTACAAAGRAIPRNRTTVETIRLHRIAVTWYRRRHVIPAGACMERTGLQGRWRSQRHRGMSQRVAATRRAIGGKSSPDAHPPSHCDSHGTASPPPAYELPKKSYNTPRRFFAIRHPQEGTLRVSPKKTPITAALGRNVNPDCPDGTECA